MGAPGAKDVLAIAYRRGASFFVRSSGNGMVVHADSYLLGWLEETFGVEARVILVTRLGAG